MIRILIIEPDKTLREVYLKLLRNDGFEVIGCSTAEGAIKVLDSEKIVDLVILELQLANHNGLEFIYELRSYAEWQKIPIVLHTMVPPGSFKSYNKKTFTNLGVVDYLYKPATTLAQLLAVVQDSTLITA